MSRTSILLLACLGAMLGGCGAMDRISEGQAQRSALEEPLQKSRTAIDQCRQRRLNKEIASYKASADCSNPQVFAALQGANYPHMDLVTVWLNAREVALDNLDKGQITEAEFQRQMAELTLRLTVEERKRRAGLMNNQEDEAETPPASTRTAGTYLGGLSALQATEPQTATVNDVIADRAKENFRNVLVASAPKRAAPVQAAAKPAPSPRTTTGTQPASSRGGFGNRFDGSRGTQ